MVLAETATRPGSRSGQGSYSLQRAPRCCRFPYCRDCNVRIRAPATMSRPRRVAVREKSGAA